jgi:hypothetical protein
MILSVFDPYSSCMFSVLHPYIRLAFGGWLPGRRARETKMFNAPGNFATLRPMSGQRLSGVPAGALAWGWRARQAAGF